MPNWTEEQLRGFYESRGEAVRPAGAIAGEPKAPRPRKQKTTKLEPVSGPLEWSVTVYGHCPSKKNLWQRGNAGVMFLPTEVKEQIAAITTQLMFAWKYPGPVRHPELTVKFFVGAQRQDQDGMYTTVLDCLQAAGVIVNDNVAHFNGRKVLEPCEFVDAADERVEVSVRVKEI